jgi:hypothetical protein
VLVLTLTILSSPNHRPKPPSEHLNHNIKSLCENEPNNNDNKIKTISSPNTHMICNTANPNPVLNISSSDSKKVNNLECMTNQFRNIATKNLVINLSTHPIDENTTRLLEKGLNFAIAPRKIPFEDILCSIENSIKNLPDYAKEEIRQDCSVILRRVKPPKNNITKEESLALKSLNNNKNLVFLKADKGGATVVMNKENYIEKMLDHLNNSGSYKKLNKNPLNKIAKEVSKAIKLSNIKEDDKKKLIVSCPSTPRIYGLPKIHKEGAPLRPIVNTIGSPTYQLAKYLANKLKPLVGNTSSFVKDSSFFVNKIKNIKVDKDDILVSFDVVSLFTKIPIDGAINVIRNITDPGTANLIELCLKSTFFSFQGDVYEQTCGVAMGSPLSPIIANLFMEDLENNALNSSPFKPKYWNRFVDDTFVIWPHGWDKLDEFVTHLNKQSDHIKFTIEVENNNSLPFLDVRVTKRPDGSLSHQVYRKKTHIEQYLHADSHHHPSQKLGVLNTLATRAFRISDDEHLEEEKKHLLNVFKNNGYKKHQVMKAFQNATKTPRNKEQTNNEVSKVYLPYIQGTTDKLAKILKKKNIGATFKPLNTIRNSLRSVKDSVDPIEHKGVYMIPCSCGKQYIGETGRSFRIRIQEHAADIKHNRTRPSALAEHSDKTKHHICIEETKILARIDHYHNRKFREAIEIEKQPNNLNRDDGWKISHNWIPTLANMKNSKY